jgi:glycosyltransferase involved in cell wall biosynthesis
MRILAVSPHLPPSHIGGVETYTAALTSALVRRGQSVHAVAVDRIDSGHEDACAATEDTPSGGAPTSRLALTLGPRTSFTMLTRHAPTEAWFAEHIAATAPDVVHVQSGYLLGAPALAAARRAEVPAVLTLHDYWFACPRVTLQHPDGAVCSGPERPAKCAWCLTTERRAYRWLDTASGKRLSAGRDRSALWRAAFGAGTSAVAARQKELRALLDTAAAVLAATRFVATQVAATGYPADRILSSRCGIPEIRPRKASATRPLRLAFIGQVAPHKGVHLAIEAVRALDGRELSLAIHGPLTPHPAYVAQLRRAAADDPRITFHGPYRRDDLAELFDQTDLVVVPSVWHEVAALVIQEAQMAGVPVLASNLGGSPELVIDGVDGLLFDPADSGALTRQIARVLDEPGLLPRLQAAVARPRSVDDEVDALLDLYARVRHQR